MPSVPDFNVNEAWLSQLGDCGDVGELMPYVLSIVLHARACVGVSERVSACLSKEQIRCCTTGEKMRAAACQSYTGNTRHGIINEVM